jgi:hypothetical protein
MENWSAMLPDRQVIEEFMEHLIEKCGETAITDILVDKELDAFHKVDRKKLERERRGLLDQMQRLVEETWEEKEQRAAAFLGPGPSM